MVFSLKRLLQAAIEEVSDVGVFLRFCGAKLLESIRVQLLP